MISLSFLGFHDLDAFEKDCSGVLLECPSFWVCQMFALITGDVNLDHLVIKMVSASFLHCKVTFPPPL